MLHSSLNPQLSFLIIKNSALHQGTLPCTEAEPRRNRHCRLSSTHGAHTEKQRLSPRRSPGAQEAREPGPAGRASREDASRPAGPGAPSPRTPQRAARRLPTPSRHPEPSSATKAGTRTTGARSPGGGGTGRGEGEAEGRGPDPGGGHAGTGPGAARPRAARRDARLPDARQPRAHACGAGRGPGATCGRDGERLPRSRVAPTGAGGRRGRERCRAARRRREARAGAGAGGEDAPGCRAGAGGGAAAVGPTARPSARAMQQVHLAAGLRGPRPPLPAGQPPSPKPSSAGVKAGHRQTAGCSPHSPVRGSAAGAGAALSAPWSRRFAAARRPHPAPPRTQRRQRRRLRPGHGRGHAPSRRGARPEREGGPAPAPPTRAGSPAAAPGLASASANGGAAGVRRVGAGGRGIAEEVALALRPPPLGSG